MAWYDFFGGDDSVAVDDTYTAEDFADSQAFVDAQAESGAGQLQSNLGQAFVDSSVGDYQTALGKQIVQDSLDDLPPNVGRDGANALQSSGGSLGDLFKAARNGLTTSAEAARLGLDYQRLIADPYSVGTGPNSGTVIPPRVNGDGRPGTISGAWGLPWAVDTKTGQTTVDPTKAALVIGAAILGGLALKKALA